VLVYIVAVSLVCYTLLFSLSDIFNPNGQSPDIDRFDQKSDQADE